MFFRNKIKKNTHYHDKNKTGDVSQFSMIMLIKFE